MQVFQRKNLRSAWKDFFLAAFDIKKLGISIQPRNATFLVILKKKIALTNLFSF